MGHPVRLTYAELLLAGTAGVMRRVENIRKQRQPRYGCPRVDNWRRDIEGVVGEMVLAKHLNVYWEGKGTFGGKDVDGQQVRCAQPGGHLLLHPDDDDDDVFWLVRGEDLDYVVEGWIHGRDGKQEHWWRDVGNGRPAFFVPVAALHNASVPVRPLVEALP